MKKILSILILAFAFESSIMAQAIHIFQAGNDKADIYTNSEVDSIRIKPIESAPESYEYRIYTQEGLFCYPADKVDGIKFNMPYIKLKSNNIDIPAEYGVAAVNFSARGQGGIIPIIKFEDGSEQQASYGMSEIGIGNGETIAEGHIDLYISGEEGEKKSEKLVVCYGEVADETILNYTGIPLLDSADRNFIVSSEDDQIIIKPKMPGVIIYSEDNEWGSWYQNSDGNWVLDIKKNESDAPRYLNFRANSEDFMTFNNQVGQVRKFKHSAEEHMSALRDFYNSTSLPELETNWFTDKPLWEWDYVNHNIWWTHNWHIRDHVVTLFTGGGQYTGITGTLPPSFEVFLDDVADYMGGELDLTQCALYGKIPDNIKNNPNWQRWGWNIIQQSRYFGGGFDMDNMNLHIDDAPVTDFVNNETSSTYQILAKNKITWIFNAGAVDMIDGISDERVNKYLDYKDKGLGVVVTVGGYWDVTYDNYIDYVKEQYEVNGLPMEIMWTKGFDKGDIGSYGSMSLVDDKGNLLWYSEFDYSLPESFWIDQVDEVCRKYLGEPVEHDLYVSNLYESQDYSNDGVVLTLQKATMGLGIDLVFTGDAFIDTDLEEGGVFEAEMYSAMENFFDVEPYRTLRDRFNVYAVKAVSKNDYRGSNHAFDYDDQKVMEYVSKVPGVDMDNVTVCVINFDPNFQMFMSGYTNMFESGASIAYIQQGNASSIIAHEAGGHGFAKLLDEYIFGGYDDNKVPEDDLESFHEYIKTYYHDRGWGMNVSYSDKPEDTPWYEFLTDERYSGEIGIYEGAWMWPHDLWRPSENSLMNTDYTMFNAPSRRAIYERVMKLSEGNDWTYDHEEFVAFDQQIMRRAHNASHTKKDLFNKDNTSPVLLLRSPRINSQEYRDGIERFCTSKVKKENDLKPVSKVIKRDRTAIYVLP